MLQYASPHIDPYLTHIINCSFESNYFPDSWKKSIGCPINKKGNPNSLSDIRLISILPVFSKVMESIMTKQIYAFCLASNILPPCQAGFRKKYFIGLIGYSGAFGLFQGVRYLESCIVACQIEILRFLSKTCQTFIFVPIQSHSERQS